MSDDIKLMVFKIELLIYDGFISAALIKKRWSAYTCKPS